MEYKLLDIVAVQEPLKKLYDTPMSVYTASLILKGIIEVDKILKQFDKDKKKIFIDYGDEQKDGSYLVPDENTEEFQIKIDELLDQTFELENFPLHFHGDGDFKVSPNMLNALQSKGFFHVEEPYDFTSSLSTEAIDSPE